MSPTLPEPFTSRPATMDDLEAAVELFNRCSQDQIGAAAFDQENLRMEWEDPTFDPQSHAHVVLTPEGKLVGYVEVWDPEPHVRLYVWGRTDPDYQGRGIGSYLMAWGEERARQAIPKAPEGARVTAITSVVSTDEPAQQLYRQMGYRLERHFLRMVIEMDAPPPAPEIPEGLILRPYRQGSEERALLKATDEAFKDHWGHVDRPIEKILEQWTHWMENSPDFDPTLWFVAEDLASGEIAAMSLCNPQITEDPDMGWVGTLGVRRPWRRQGLAQAMLLYSFGEFYRRGKRRVGLAVDAQSLTGATRLYEKVGMHTSRAYAHYEKELREGKDMSTQQMQTEGEA